MLSFWKRRAASTLPVRIGQLSFDEVLELDAIFTRWRDEDDFGPSLRVTDGAKRGCD